MYNLTQIWYNVGTEIKQNGITHLSVSTKEYLKKKGKLTIVKLLETTISCAMWINRKNRKYIKIIYNTHKWKKDIQCNTHMEVKHYNENKYNKMNCNKKGSGTIN